MRRSSCFKQKTAYEIGLGIPAEPLFRSFSASSPLRKIILIKQELLLLVYELNRSGLLAENEKIRPILAQLERSEERRVGKEWRYRWRADKDRKRKRRSKCWRSTTIAQI